MSACLIATPARADLGDELLKLTASDGAVDDMFGWSVDISGNIAIVGAEAYDNAGDRSGSAYLFDVTTGQELRKLTASDAAADAIFGKSVAINGNVAIVGAQRHNNTAGAAYLFEVTTGQELFKLTASDAMPGKFFGGSVAISGNTAVVGLLSVSPPQNWWPKIVAEIAARMCYARTTPESRFVHWQLKNWLLAAGP